MSPALAAAIDAARDVAWRPIANLSPFRYQERLEAATEFRTRLGAVTGLSANASIELRCLHAAMLRAAAASFANRRGLPYYERRQAILELRGALDVWERSRS